MTEFQNIEQIFARLRAGATADRLRRMIFQGVVFADEIDDVAVAVQTLSFDPIEPHPLMDLLLVMGSVGSPDDMIPLHADQCAWLAEAEVRLEALSTL